MQSVTISQSITSKINELEKLKDDLSKLSELKALASSEYEKQIALTIMGLRNGVEYQIGGIIVADTSISLIDKLAKGICYHQKLHMDLSDSKYKNTLKIIEITEAQLNGYQSINRHLSEA